MTVSTLLLPLLLLSAQHTPRPNVDPVRIPPPPSGEALAEAPSFGPDEHVVATHYFYWYRWPDEHFFDDRRGQDSSLRHHFPDDRAVSYESKAWHRQQMEDMLAAGIDVALCVYWGAPNQYEKPEIRFSVHGLPPLVAALDELAARGPTPRIGLFYDTSTLLAEHAFQKPGRENVDLRTDEGKDIFYRTIRDFFCLVPPRHWACLDGRPIVQLYNAAFSSGHDQGVIDYAVERFAADFAGRRPFIIAGPSWSVVADARTGWGAAIGGPILAKEFAQIGPGYDDSPVPGRTTPTRDRLGGGFYAASWLLALQARPRLVTIETWSELHEGTGICETLEDGRYYIDLTRRYSDLLKSGQTASGDEWASAVQTLLQTQHSSRSGRQYASRLGLNLHIGPGGRLVEDGLRLCKGVADGAWAIGEANGKRCIQTRPGVSKHRYVYIDIADPYYHDHRGMLTLRVTYLDAGHDALRIHYDASVETRTGPTEVPYHPHPVSIERADTGEWKTATLTLKRARCANSQNGGADFRFEVSGADVSITRIEVSKLPDNYGP